jgi:exopolysaccharide production protein ExoQ
MTFLRRFRLEDIAAVLILSFFGIAGAIPGIAPNQANEMTGAAASRLQTVAGIGSQLFVNVLIAMLLIAGWQLFSRHRGALRWSSMLAIWAVFSILWSQDPLLTGRRALPFVFATAFGMFLALRYPQDRLLSLLQITFAVLACWSAVLAVGFPAIGLDASTGHGGDWQGVFTQKNACGRAMVFAIAAVLARRRFSFPSAACVVLFAGELMMSGSRGAWLLGAVTVAALLVFRFSCRFDRASRSVFLAMLAGLAVTACAIAVLDFGDLAPLLGRDATLTGRTAIWHEVWLSILHRPALGYGFSAFWRGAQGASWSVVVALHFVLFHAHNGFLEIWLELGAAGLLLFTAGYVRAAVLLWPELRAGRYREAAWPSVVLLLIALYDIDENTLLSFNGLFWVLYTGALTRIELLAADRSMVQRHLRAEKSVSSVPLPWIGLGAGAGRLDPEERKNACCSVQGQAFLIRKPLSDQSVQTVEPWL